MPTIQKNSFKLSLLAAAMSPLFGLGMTQSAIAADSVAEALKEGDTVISLRARYEDVDVDVHGADAQAGTLKTRATYTSGDFNGLGMTLEFDDVTAFTKLDYNDGVEQHDEDGTATKIVDPEGTGVNQAYLSYKAADTTVKYGRQRILLDNQRFVGGVGFRQNEQTYDAISVSNNSIKNLSIFAARIYNVDGITGTSTDHETNLVNASYQTPVGKATGYYYDIDQEANDTDSTKTMGARFAGKADAGGAEILYTAEYAKQTEGSDDAASFDTTYTHLMGGVAISGVTVKLGLESLGADEDAGKTFATPLATKHKFQGWADTLLGHGTAGAGINDLYLTVGTNVAGIKVMGVYHQFTSIEDITGGADSGDEYGTEVGFVVAKKLDNGIGLNLKYANFSEGDDSLNMTDVSKLWLTSTYQF